MGNSRSEIRHNFLKQIMFRLDFDGILESDVEKCVLELRQSFIDAGFGEMEKRAENQVDIQLKIDLNIPNENQFSISNANKSLVYRFLSEKNEVLELSKSFFTLTIDIDKVYKTFDKYISLLAGTVEKIRLASPYFRALRIGLRKINICFLKNLDDLPAYFNKAAFNIQEIKEQFLTYKCRASNMVTILVEKQGYLINYIRNIQEGIMQDDDDGNQQTVYQVVLDIDVFKENNKEILPVLSGQECIEDTLEKQNTIEFEVFIKSLSEEFVKKLKAETFIDNIILGVN